MIRPKNNVSKVRILVNALHAKSGGGVTYLRNLLPHLAGMPDLDVHLFLHVSQYPLFEKMPEGVHLHLLDSPTGFLGLLWWEQFALPILAYEMDADITFSPANYGPLFIRNSVIMLRNSLAVVIRERRIGRWAYWISLAIGTIVSLLRCRRAIAVSEYARRNMGFHFPGSVGRKVRVIYHGVDERFTPPAPGTSREEDSLLVVSDVYVQKNLHTLIPAMAQVRRQRPNARLRIAGHLVDKEYHGELVSRAKQLGIDDAVEFMGGLDPDVLLNLYRSCTIFVFVSTVETFGNPLVEAMACGAPIISSNTTAMPEVAGDAAVYVNPLSDEEIAVAIISLLDDPSRRDDLARRSLERVRRFSWKLTAEMTREVLLEAAGR